MNEIRFKKRHFIGTLAERAGVDLSTDVLAVYE